MKRRAFLRNAGAAAMAPLIPTSVFAAPASVSVPVIVNEFQLGWATLLARVNNQATPELIQKWLRVSATDANGLMGELLKRNVVQSSVSGGTVAVKPMYSGGKAPGFMKKSKDILEKISELASDDEDTLEPEEQPDDEALNVEEVGIDPAPEVQEV